MCWDGVCVCVVVLGCTSLSVMPMDATGVKTMYEDHPGYGPRKSPRSLLTPHSAIWRYR
jgi:hypothetical protein